MAEAPIVVTVELSPSALDAIAERVAVLVGKQCAGSPWMTRKVAAAYLGLPVSRLEKARDIPSHRDAGRVLYHRDELDAHFLGLGPCGT